MRLPDFEPMFEALLRQAIRDNIYEEAETVPKDDVLSSMFIISKRHNARMQRLCAREDRREQVRVFIRPVSKVAIVVMIIITITFSALLTNTVVQAAVRDVLVEWFEQFTRFVGISDLELTVQPGLVSWAPEFLPSGYEEESFFESDSTVIEYGNGGTNTIIFRYSPGDNDLRVDNEASNYTIVKIEDIEYFIFDKLPEHKPNSATWYSSGFNFYLSGYVGIEVLLDIAISVRKIK